MAGKSLSADKKNGLKVTVDTLEDLHEAIKLLARDEVLVGVPEEKTERDEEDGTKSPITNASLAYIHDNGAPEVNIPARPFMREGIEDVRGSITETQAKQAQYVLMGNKNKVSEGYQRVGMLAVKSIQARINAGIPPPLAESTLKRRAQKGRKGAQKELDARAAGLPPGMSLAKPLIDTAEMLKSISYVVRNRNKRRR